MAFSIDPLVKGLSQKGDFCSPNGEKCFAKITHLFCGTVRENLLVAHANATDAELLDACRSASLTKIGRASCRERV